MRCSITIVAFLLSLSVFANDTLYFRLSNPWNTVKDPKGEYLRKCVIEKGYCHVWDYNKKHILVTESFYSDTNFTTKLFCHKYYNEEGGWLEETRCYLNGRLDGYFVDYDKHGDTTAYTIYKEGEETKSWSLHPEEDSIEEAELAKLLVDAEFRGGKQAWLKYLGNNIEYPASLKDKTIKGEVVVAFTITPEGKLVDVHVVKSLNPELDQEAVRVIQRSPRWKPAMQNHKKVPAQMTQSINF